MIIGARKSRNHGHPGPPGAPKREVNRRKWSSEIWWQSALRKRGQGGGQKEGCGCLNLVKYIGGAAKSRMTASSTKPPKKVSQDPLSDAPVEPFPTKRDRKATVEKTRFWDHFREPKDAYNDASKSSFFVKKIVPETCFSDFRSVWGQNCICAIPTNIEFARFVEFAKPP